MRVLVTGSRDWYRPDVIWQCLDKAMASVPNEDFVLVHGDCRGADTMADEWAAARGVRVEKYPADWSQGKKAGPLRNIQMVDTNPDLVLAFPTTESRGTIQCVNYAAKKGIKVIKTDEHLVQVVYDMNIASLGIW